MAHDIFLKYFSRKILFFGKNISKIYHVPYGRQKILISKISIIIFPKYFMRENANGHILVTTFQKIIYGTTLFSQKISENNIFRGKYFEKISCAIWSPNILIAKKSLIIFPKYFLQGNALISLNCVLGKKSVACEQ